MIRFAGERDGRRFVAVGLSRENTVRLLAGQPMVMNFETSFGMPELHLDLYIMAGETEESMQEDLRSEGLLRGTKINVEPRGKAN
jgi:hypothetical protein